MSPIKKFNRGIAASFSKLFSKKKGKKRQRSILRDFGFVLPQPFGASADAADNVVTWLVPDYDVGSGGHTTLFRLIHLLEQRGIRCEVNIDGPCKFATGDEVRADIHRNFFPIDATVTIGRAALRPSAVVVATHWPTAYTARDFAGARARFYFVQDMEPYFYARGSLYEFAEDTYRFGFIGLTAGDWIADRLRTDYGMQAAAFGFSYDRAVYRHADRRGARKRVFFYARPITARRGFELGILALAQLKQTLPEVEVVLAGGDVSRYEIPFDYRSVGIVPAAELADIYRQCHAALVISLTNLSLLPLELMACGCAVVSNSGPHVEWLLNADNAELAAGTVDGLAQALLRVVADDAYWARKVDAGRRFAEATRWETEADKIAAVLADYVAVGRSSA